MCLTIFGYWVLQGSDFHAQRFSKLIIELLENLTLFTYKISKPLLKLASRKAQMIVVVRYKLLYVKHHALTFSVSETIISLNVILMKNN